MIDTAAADTFLSQTVLVNGWGMIGIIVFLVVVIPFVIMRRPEPPEHPADIHQHTSNAMWWMIAIACVIVALAFAGELVGIDTMQGVTPR